MVSVYSAKTIWFTFTILNSIDCLKSIIRIIIYLILVDKGNVTLSIYKKLYAFICFSIPWHKQAQSASSNTLCFAPTTRPTLCTAEPQIISTGFLEKCVWWFFLTRFIILVDQQWAQNMYLVFASSYTEISYSEDN